MQVPLLYLGTFAECEFDEHSKDEWRVEQRSDDDVL